MTQGFEERFRGELIALRALFGRARVDVALPRVHQIHEYTEAMWKRYVATLHGGVVRYVLIAEAPPWSVDGTPQYLLDPSSSIRALMPALRRAFPGAGLGSAADALKALARHGFLLLDSIPFPMEYRAKRSSEKYDDLIKLTMTSYLQTKIDSSSLEWSPDLRIAFAVDRNARAILKAITQLSMGGRQHPLSSQMIAVNGAGYPDASKLRVIYGLRTDSTA
jgi:hypothetical protein